MSRGGKTHKVKQEFTAKLQGMGMDYHKHLNNNFQKGAKDTLINAQNIARAAKTHMNFDEFVKLSRKNNLPDVDVKNDIFMQSIQGVFGE